MHTSEQQEYIDKQPKVDVIIGFFLDGRRVGSCTLSVTETHPHCIDWSRFNKFDFENDDLDILFPRIWFSEEKLRHTLDILMLSNESGILKTEIKYGTTTMEIVCEPSP